MDAALELRLKRNNRKTIQTVILARRFFTVNIKRLSKTDTFQMVSCEIGSYFDAGSGCDANRDLSLQQYGTLVPHRLTAGVCLI
jgi:hypothetical protein